jgi:hypothetical protein
MSVLAHDDLHVFETIQQALRADGNPWVSLARGHVAPEHDGQTAEVGGTDERLIRNQFRAWAAAMGAVPQARPTRRSRGRPGSPTRLPRPANLETP